MLIIKQIYTIAARECYAYLYDVANSILIISSGYKCDLYRFHH